MMGDVQLFDYWRSSASYRVRIALNLAGIAYTSIGVDLVKQDQKSAEHLKRNPQGLVPVLDIDGQRLTQSLAIIDYLGETRSLKLLPDDPIKRATVRALAHTVAVDIHPVCNTGVVAHVAKLVPGETVWRDWMQNFITPGLAAFEALLAGFDGGRFCAGDDPGLADICLMPQLYNARRWNVDLSRFAGILRIEQACANHPAFAVAHPDEVNE